MTRDPWILCLLILLMIPICVGPFLNIIFCTALFCKMFIPKLWILREQVLPFTPKCTGNSFLKNINLSRALFSRMLNPDPWILHILFFLITPIGTIPSLKILTSVCSIYPIYTSSSIESDRCWSYRVEEYLPQYCLILYNINLNSMAPMCTSPPIDSYVHF